MGRSRDNAAMNYVLRQGFGKGQAPKQEPPTA
jgi:hypothetical protein